MQALQRLATERIEQLRHQPAAQTMIHQLVMSSMAKDQKFYLVKIPEDGLPSVEEFEAIEAMVDRIIELLGTETAIFPFMGYWLGISKGPLRYLITPFGMLPLYRLPRPGEVEVEASGWVGREAPVEIPQRPVAPQAAIPAPAAAELLPQMPAVPDAPSPMPPDDGTPVIVDVG